MANLTSPAKSGVQATPRYVKKSWAESAICCDPAETFWFVVKQEDTWATLVHF